MTTHHRIILDRDDDPTVELECEWNFHSCEPGSAAICAAWELDRVTAKDADSGKPVELDESERLWISEQLQPNMGRFST